MSTDWREVNQRLLKIFGLEGLRVTSLTVCARMNELPTLTITRKLIDAGDVREVTQVFDLQLRQEESAPTRENPAHISDKSQ